MWLLLAFASGACRSSHSGPVASAPSLSITADALPAVTAPPDSFFNLVRERDREAARKFYKKYIDVKGMPAVASAEVSDAALQRAHTSVTHMLAGRPDIVAAMATNGMYLIISVNTDKSPEMWRQKHGDRNMLKGAALLCTLSVDSPHISVPIFLSSACAHLCLSVSICG
jgi:hypothetical protein